MQLIDFNDYSQNNRMYGGLSGSKIGICYNDENYILKYPKNLRNVNMKNVVLSYSNSPVCEYLGSHIYDIMDIPVHETLLGTRRNKIVVACKDFLGHGDNLYEFREIKTTFEPHFEDENGYGSSGNGTDLDEILQIIEEHPLLNYITEVKTRFWDMFVIDAFIGNMDRNNGNWGIIARYDGSIELAPVYDNGGCFNNKWDDEKMQRYMEDSSLLEAQAYKGIICIFTKDDKHINPFHYLANTNNADCLAAIKRIVPKLKKNMPAIYYLLDNTSVLSDTQREFYRLLIDKRLNLALKPIYDKHFGYENFRGR